ncbi:hypothetical protein QR98_0097650 [Sarcoptes scabiei]|uniref:Uncharacterized protein n=1 Tax=Sarcoptes scabiei TaxID=52283 RepID=A0A132AKU6_SARSC|nr:hypothetical protein QR98_0097650 [Sarcoptes scabiei]
MLAFLIEIAATFGGSHLTIHHVIDVIEMCHHQIREYILEQTSQKFQHHKMIDSLKRQSSSSSSRSSSASSTSNLATVAPNRLADSYLDILPLMLFLIKKLDPKTDYDFFYDVELGFFSDQKITKKMATKSLNESNSNLVSYWNRIRMRKESSITTKAIDVQCKSNRTNYLILKKTYNCFYLKCIHLILSSTPDCWRFMTNHFIEIVW